MTSSTFSDEQVEAMSLRILKTLANAADGDRSYIAVSGDSVVIDAGFTTRELVEAFAKEFNLAP